MQDQRVVVWFSCAAASAVAAKSEEKITMSKRGWSILREALAELCLSFPSSGGYGYSYTLEDEKRFCIEDAWNFAFWQSVK